MRLDYETFKMTFAEAFPGFLPETYDSWCVKVDRVPKVNGYMDALHLFREDGNGLSPTLYFNDLYRDYLQCGDVEEVCEKAAKSFIRGLEYAEKAAPYTELAEPMNHVIFQLVNTERNTELLANVPHREILDLALIYRLLIKCPGEQFNSAIITHELAEEIGARDEDDLYLHAAINTPKLLPLHVDDIGPGIFVVTNEMRTIGASAILYPKALDELCEEMGSDIILLPSSVHEFFVSPCIFEHPKDLCEIVKESNTAFCNREEILSKSAYVYKKSTRKLEIL